MNTRAFRGLCALVLVTSANGALYNLSDQELLEGGTTAVNQPTISSIPAVIINGGLFQRGAANSGSGTFRDIVRFDGDRNQPNGFDSGQHAYNRETDGTSFQDGFIGQEDGVIQVQDMIPDSTGNYYVFRLDINNEGFTSIDQLQIWTDPNIIPGGVASNPNNYSELTTALGVTPNVYDFDAGSDSTIFLNSDDTPGSGSSDLAFFIPQANFNGAAPTDYVFFYAQMNAFDETTVVGGLTEADGTTVVDISSKNGNHESFAVPVQENDPVVAIPEPGSTTLLLLATAMGIGRRRRS